MIRQNSGQKKLERHSGPEDAKMALSWLAAPEKMELATGQLDLWAAGMGEFRDQEEKFSILLSATERDAAEKFVFAEDRDRYVIRRGLLRQILGRYLGQTPKAIEFQYGAHGKPELRSGGNGRPPFFNTSHSADLFACAITSACPVGVDIEQTREISELEGIAKRYFSPKEAQSLLALSRESRVRAFYGCWTSKEAYLKATGDGIAENLAKVEVTTSPDEEPRVMAVGEGTDAYKEWRLHRFSPATGYLGCVAYRNKPLTIRKWRVATSAQ